MQRLFLGNIKGPKGIDGTNGMNGKDGISAGFGTPTARATLLSAGSAPTVNVTANGDDTHKVFDFAFGIPKGDKGDRGEKGANGEQGFQRMQIVKTTPKSIGVGIGTYVVAAGQGSATSEVQIVYVSAKLLDTTNFSMDAKGPVISDEWTYVVDNNTKNIFYEERLRVAALDATPVAEYHWQQHTIDGVKTEKGTAYYFSSGTKVVTRSNGYFSDLTYRVPADGLWYLIETKIYK